MAPDELVVDAAGDAGHVERARFLGEHGVEDHLVEEVAELVLERAVRACRSVARRRVGRQRLDRLHDLVRLLEHVARERVVRLIGVPGTPAGSAQPFGQSEQPRELAGGRARAAVDEQCGEVIGVDVAIEVGERDGAHLLVVEPETLEHRHRRVGRKNFEEHQLHVRQQEARVALRDEDRTAGDRVLGREMTGIGETGAGHRVDTEPRPRQLAEREAGHDLEHDVAERGGVAQELDAALGDGRVAGHGVHHLAAGSGDVEELGGDAVVDVVEVVGGVVVVIEAAEIETGVGQFADGGMPGRADVPVRDLLEDAAGGGEYVVGARRPEADDHDAAAHGYGTGSGIVVVVAVGWRGAPRGDTTLPRPPRTTQRPYRGSTSTSARATSASSWRCASGDCCSRRCRSGPSSSSNGIVSRTRMMCQPTWVCTGADTWFSASVDAACWNCGSNCWPSMQPSAPPLMAEFRSVDCWLASVSKLVPARTWVARPAASCWLGTRMCDTKRPDGH